MKSSLPALWAILTSGGIHVHVLPSLLAGFVGASASQEAELTNLARGPNAVATQSTTCYNGLASRAIDGDTDPTVAGGSMAHTCAPSVPDDYSWWMVDLDASGAATGGADTDQEFEVHSITVYNRQDGYLSTLSYSWIEVLDSQQRPVFSQKLPPNSRDPSWTIDLHPPAVGKFVRVRMYVQNYLVMSEVEVFGRPKAIVAPPGGLAKNIALSPNAVASQSSTCDGGEAANAIDGNSYGHLGTNAGSMAQTCAPDAADEFSWWMVDLDAVTMVEQVIKEITVYNRIDGYLSSLSYSFVEVLDNHTNTVSSQKLPVNTRDPSWTLEYDPPLIGRFVRLRMYNKYSALIVAEVEIIGFPITDMTDEPTSVPTSSPTTSSPSRSPSVDPTSAPTEPVSTNLVISGDAEAAAAQSTTCNGGEASRAIDGDTDPGVATFTCEDDPSPAWWIVDLDALDAAAAAEAGSEEQVQFEFEIDHITIFNYKMYSSRLGYAQVQVYDTDMNMVAFKDFPKLFNGPVHSWEFDPPAVGRYVKVQMSTPGPLHFAEIEVWGHPYSGSTGTGSIAPPKTTTPSATCPPPFDRPEGLQPEAQSILAGALHTLREHMIAGPSSDPPLLNQTEILAVTDAVLATSHQLTATYDLMEAALALVEAYEGAGGYGLPVSYGPPIFDSGQFSRERGALDGRELDRSMMLIQQVILDQMYHANLWGENGVPRVASSDMIDWSYRPVIRECQELFRGRKWWAAKYIPGLVDPPADPTVVHTELVKADYAPNWGRPTAFSNLRRAAYPIGGLYLAPGGVAQVTVPQEIVDHGGYHIQIGSQMVDCSRNGHNRQERMTTSFPVEDVTTFVANPFGGELYIRAPYGSLIPNAQVSVTGDVVQGATFFYSALRNTTEEEWNDLRATAPAPFVHIVTDPFLRQWYAPPVKEMTYSLMVERARRYTVAYNAASASHGIPPEKRNTFVLFESHSSNRCGRASVGTVGYPQANSRYLGSVDGPVPHRYEFDVQDPVIGWGICCGVSPSPHAHDPEGTEIDYDITSWHEFGHQALHRYSLFGGGEQEALPHLSYFTARLALEGENDKTSVDPTGIDTAFMFSCCKIQNPYTWAPRYTIDRQAIEWMTRDNFRNNLPMSNEEIRYQHRGHVKYADIARLTGGVEYLNEFMLEEHERWEAEGLGEGLGNGGDYWWRVSDTTWLTELEDTSSEARTLRLSLKAGEDLSPLLQFWGVHTDSTLLKPMMVTRGLYPSQVQKDLLLKYKSLIPQNSSSLEASFREVWVPEITKKNFDEWQQRADLWNQTMVDQAEAMIDEIIETHWPTGSRKLSLGAPTNPKGGHLRKSPPHSVMPVKTTASRNLINTAAFDDALNKWTISSGPAMHYKFTFARDFFGPDDLKGPFVVTVVNGVVAQVDYAREDWQEDVVDEIDLSQIPTIKGLFDFIADSMDKPDDIVHVAYEETAGYPEKIFVEYDGEDEDESVDDIEFMIIDVSGVTIIGGEDEA